MALPEALSVDSFQDRVQTKDRLTAALNVPLTMPLSPSYVFLHNLKHNRPRRPSEAQDVVYKYKD